MEYYDTHRAGWATAGLIIGATLSWLGIQAQQAGGWARGPGQVLTLVGAVTLLMGILEAGFYIIESGLDFEERHRRNASISAQARLLEAASRLTPEQATLLPGLDYAATEVDVLDGQSEMLFYLVTPEGRIPLKWLKDYLDNSGVTWLYPVRNYSEGTPQYGWARAFTSWCITRGYALPSEGNRPAQWTSEQTKSRLQKRFGLEPADLEGDTDGPSIAL